MTTVEVYMGHIYALIGIFLAHQIIAKLDLKSVTKLVLLGLVLIVYLSAAINFYCANTLWNYGNTEEGMFILNTITYLFCLIFAYIRIFHKKYEFVYRNFAFVFTTLIFILTAFIFQLTYILAAVAVGGSLLYSKRMFAFFAIIPIIPDMLTWIGFRSKNTNKQKYLPNATKESPLPRIALFASIFLIVWWLWHGG